MCGFRITANKMLADKRLLIKFPDFITDGMRCDIKGNLYIARPGKGAVDVVSPQGKLLRSVDVLGKQPTNLCFGGPDGRTIYVTEAERGRLVKFRTEFSGLEWERWK